MPKPSFINLWSNYPDHTVRQCSDNYPNECAIRMSITLNAEQTLKVNAKTYSEPKCTHDHARGAESLANWLYRKIGVPKVYKDAGKAKIDLAEKTGIIFFKDCFTRAGETRQAGDHIDLWNKGFTKSYDDPQNKSAQVWFWELR